MTIWESLTTREQSYVNVIAQEMAYDVFGMRWSRLGMNQRDALTLAAARLFRNGRLDRKLMTVGDPAPMAYAADALDGYRSVREQSIRDEQRAEKQAAQRVKDEQRAEKQAAQRVDFDKLVVLLKAIEAYDVLNEAVRNASQA